MSATNLLSLLYSRAKSSFNRFNIKFALNRTLDVHYRYTNHFTTRISVSTSLLTYIVLRFYDNTSISVFFGKTTVTRSFRSLWSHIRTGLDTKHRIHESSEYTFSTIQMGATFRYQHVKNDTSLGSRSITTVWRVKESSVYGLLLSRVIFQNLSTRQAMYRYSMGWWRMEYNILYIFIYLCHLSRLWLRQAGRA